VTAPHELALDVGWGVLSALAWPNPGAPRVLCLHGWMDNAASFMPLASCLENFDLVALDFAGHGHSEHRPQGARYYLPDYAFDLDAALDALGWPSCDIIGHSLGAGVGSIYADAAPPRVRKLAMLDAVGPVTADDDEAYKRIQQSLKSVRKPRRHKRLYPAVEDAAKVRQERLPMAMSSAILLARRGLQEEPGGYRWRTDPRLMWTSPILMAESQSLSLLRNIQCPVLVIVTPVLNRHLGATVDRRIAAIPRHRRVDIEGGHHVHMDDPGAVAPHLTDFLTYNGTTQ